MRDFMHNKKEEGFRFEVPDEANPLPKIVT